jgi:hypothetical protein
MAEVPQNSSANPSESEPESDPHPPTQHDKTQEIAALQKRLAELTNQRPISETPITSNDYSHEEFYDGIILQRH